MVSQKVEKAFFLSFRRKPWFDEPFDRLTVLSKVEGLTTLSYVEGQYIITKIQMTKTLYAPLFFELTKWMFCFGHWNIRALDLFRPALVRPY